MKRIHQWLCVALCALLCGIALPGCGGNEQGDDKKEEEIVFADLWTEGTSHAFTAGSEFTLDFALPLGEENNYIKYEFTTDCSLDATMHFVGTEDAAKTYSERFYLNKGDTEFRQILDYYHTNKFAKTLSSVTFRCVGGTGGTFRLSKIAVAKFPIDFSKVNFYASDRLEKEMQLYLTGDTVKLGVTLKWGGAVNFLASVNQGIVLSSDSNQIHVGHSTIGKVYDEEVNLINAHDTGRLIQQSFYGTKGDSLDHPQDDYVCGTFDHDGNEETPEIPWPYNPVQGGDKYQNLSQLIDVQVSEHSIYVKCRPMDWAKDGSVTPFYMENTYTIRKDENYGEYVEVRNKSTDFSGYVHDNRRDQELPAFYGVNPLGTLVTYRGTKAWQDDTLTTLPNLDFWSPGTSDNRFRATENWIAWVNDEKWGVGLYVPDVETMLVGRNRYSLDISEIGMDPSQAVGCTYTAPLGSFSMPTYDPFTYTYYLKLDHITYTRAFFEQLHSAGAANPDLLRLEGRS